LLEQEQQTLVYVILAHRGALGRGWQAPVPTPTQEAALALPSCAFSHLVSIVGIKTEPLKFSVPGISYREIWRVVRKPGSGFTLVELLVVIWSDS
jgi:hypothetical protein